MANPLHKETVLEFEQAYREVEREARQWQQSIAEGRERAPTAESLPLLESNGRVLAEDLRADRSLPPFPRATRDGYAVRSADVTSATSTAPASLRVMGEIRAGAAPALTLCSGEAAAIMTGAAVPESADAVVMVEHTDAADGDPNRVLVRHSAKFGENIVPRGAEARSGSVLLRAGHRMDHAAIAVAASVGQTRVPVFSKPRVAILATGDEVVEADARPTAWQIRNSNSYSLAAQVRAAGGQPIVLPIAPDTLGDLLRLLRDGLAADLLLLSGGVSMGKYDLVELALRELGAEFFFSGALIQPGKPVLFGRVWRNVDHWIYFFGLPGNPVSTMVTFQIFARPLLEALAGAEPQPPRFLLAKLKAKITVRAGLTRFLPARLSGWGEHTEVERLPWQGSGDVVTTAQANCYIVTPPHRETLAAGEMVSVLMHGTSE